MRNRPDASGRVKVIVRGRWSRIRSAIAGEGSEISTAPWVATEGRAMTCAMKRWASERILGFLSL